MLPCAGWTHDRLATLIESLKAESCFQASQLGLPLPCHCTEPDAPADACRSKQSVGEWTLRDTLDDMAASVLGVRDGVLQLQLTPSVISGHTTLLEANIDALARSVGPVHAAYMCC